ncbi:AAC(3) family N-acetyltransferase [Sporolactobacillus shoreicorticis]|uniref:Aminoglycoside N(3)-acetyltransferase n=1 Tax=Sporolactobacillus shoreicorticis TaxID=1923877 RepID=A0ABW5S0V9_9BACL|nr:AAC(3) family N-acetyltransferase [Sporolactobacillus shoreicorticis]MCO7125276.1 AAC(3) family N-acetyltransferase [Sporolactobacillus shoreicorticis]
MSESEVIQQSKVAVTRSMLIRDLRKIGLDAGMTVIVHSSLSRMGWVCGGSVTLIMALQEVLTSAGTLVMPAHSADVSDPADWESPPVPSTWFHSIYQEMPAFDPRRTPTFGMGKVAETFRSFPGVRRSNHPIYSFTAWGEGHDVILAHHSLDDGLGTESPLGKIYERDGYVLLLGVGYGNNTSMHLGEYMSGRLERVKRSSPVRIKGHRQWVKYQDGEYHEEAFEVIGKAFEASHPEAAALHVNHVGQAPSRLLSQRAIVDFTADYIKKNAD